MAVSALVNDEQHAQLGVIVLVNDCERCAAYRIMIEFVLRVAKSALRVFGTLFIS